MATSKPRRLLGVFDATMIVMGGIVGSGVFINPYVVALRVHTPFLILGVWLAGGALAMLGAFIWAELATRLPGAGGQYLYLREAYHPAVAFLYGWVLLLVIQTGGMAAVAITFARYYREITGFSAGDGPIAVTVLLGLTAINCFGVRAGSNVQSALMLLKAGCHRGDGSRRTCGSEAARCILCHCLDQPLSFGFARALGAAMVPVAFAYGGWQTASFVAGEMRDPRRDLSRGLIAGVLGVVLLYLSVNFVCVRVLGPAGLARDSYSGIGGDARGTRRAGRAVDRFRHRSLDPWISEPGHSDRAARLLRDGSRWPVLQERWLALSALRSAGRCYRAARSDRHRDRYCRRLRADSQLRRGRRFHLLRPDRSVVVCVSTPR